MCFSSIALGSSTKCIATTYLQLRSTSDAQRMHVSASLWNAVISVTLGLSCKYLLISSSSCICVMITELLPKSAIWLIIAHGPPVTTVTLVKLMCLQTD